MCVQNVAFLGQVHYRCDRHYASSRCKSKTRSHWSIYSGSLVQAQYRYYTRNGLNPYITLRILRAKKANIREPSYAIVGTCHSHSHAMLCKICRNSPINTNESTNDWHFSLFYSRRYACAVASIVVDVAVRCHLFVYIPYNILNARSETYTMRYCACHRSSIETTKNCRFLLRVSNELERLDRGVRLPYSINILVWI